MSFKGNSFDLYVVSMKTKIGLYSNLNLVDNLFYMKDQLGGKLRGTILPKKRSNPFVISMTYGTASFSSLLQFGNEPIHFTSWRSDCFINSNRYIGLNLVLSKIAEG